MLSLLLSNQFARRRCIRSNMSRVRLKSSPSSLLLLLCQRELQIYCFPLSFFLLRQTWNFNFTHTQFNLKIFGKENIGKCCEHRLEWFNSISSMFSRRKKNKTTRFQFVRELCLCCKLALEVDQVDIHSHSCNRPIVSTGSIAHVKCGGHEWMLQVG